MGSEQSGLAPPHSFPSPFLPLSPFPHSNLRLVVVVSGAMRIILSSSLIALCLCLSGTHALAQDELTCALAHVNRGLLHIRSLFNGPNAEETFNALEEVKVLLDVRTELSGEVPVDPVIVAKRALHLPLGKTREEVLLARNQKSFMQSCHHQILLAYRRRL